MSTSLALGKDWDIFARGGNIRVFKNDNAIEQDVLTRLLLIKDESWYKNQYGIPYFDGTLTGRKLDISTFCSMISDEAQNVDGVTDVQCVAVLDDMSRVSYVKIALTTVSGAKIDISF